MIVSNRALPVYSLVIACLPIEVRVESIYPLSDVVSSGILHTGLYRGVSSSFEDLGLVCDNQSFFLRLIEVEVLVQMEVSDSCSDVQKLCSVIGYDGRNIMCKKR